MAVNGKQLRVSLRFDEDIARAVEYWVEKEKLSDPTVSMNSWVVDAILLKIRHKNGDFDVPSLLVNRINELIDSNASLATSVDNMQLVVTRGIDSLTSLARGDNSYLSDDVDPDLT